MKENQKILYEHYLKLSSEGAGKIHLEAKKHADEILKSWPEFAKVKKEVKPEAKAEVKKNDKSA